MCGTKIHGDKGYHTALMTIKQGDQHSGSNRNPKHNRNENSLFVSPPSRFDKNTENTRGHYVYIYIYMCVCVSRCTCHIYESKHVTLFNHRAKTKEKQYNKERFLEVVHRRPCYNVYYFSVGANCSVRCRDQI